MMALPARAGVSLLGALLVTLCSTASTAEISLNSRSRAFTDDRITVAVRLEAVTVDDAKYVRATWFDELEVSAFDAAGGELPVTIVRRTPGHTEDLSTAATVRPGSSGVSQHLRISNAFVSLAALPKGVITIKVKYQDLSTSLDLTVWDGQESREAEIAKLRRDASQPGLTFEEHRTRAMRLLKVTPGDWTIWWHLGERALGQVPEEEAAGYFSESVELARSLVEKNIASDDPEVRKRGLAELPGLEQQERAARAMLTLIPAFYENPERTILRLNWDDKRAELVERPPENEAATTILRFVSFASRGEAAVP